jgi:3-phenylpropionate/cinnamic acid dioxygenase small subunit
VPDRERHLDAADRIEIHELAARYGNAIDDRDWDALAAVFTDDALFVLSGFGELDDRYEGVGAIRALMETSDSHPVAHHVTNVVVSVEGGEVRMTSKIVGPGRRGRVGAADYHDRLHHGPGGWRIAERRVTLRRPDPNPVRWDRGPRP